jgi:hypothetical protein
MSLGRHEEKHEEPDTGLEKQIQPERPGKPAG